ncbi:MAG: hypothetical protein ACE5NG_10065 [bacterium]
MSANKLLFKGKHRVTLGVYATGQITKLVLLPNYGGGSIELMCLADTSRKVRWLSSGLFPGIFTSGLRFNNIEIEAIVSP